MHRTTPLRQALLIAGLAGWPVLPVAAQDTTDPRPMTVEDVLALERIGDVRISPDGRWVAYVVSKRDFENDRTESDLWVVATDGGAPRVNSSPSAQTGSRSLRSIARITTR